MKWLRLHIVRSAIGLVLLLVVLLVADRLCYQLALPVTLDEQHGITTLSVGSERLALGKIGTPNLLSFSSSDAVLHEYQIDGTDSTNNFTLDQFYLDRFASSLYYRFQAWMRDLDGTSRWRDLHIQDAHHMLQAISWPADGSSVRLPSTTTWQLS